MDEFLMGKFEDPMLGIITAHLLMSRRNTNLRLVDIVIENLVNLVGDHPDVKAVIIARDRRDTRSVGSIDCPPLLKRSWDIVVKSTRRRASIVEPDSIVASIASEVISGGPWLIHRVETDTRITQISMASIARSNRIFERLLTIDQKRFYELIGSEREIFENLSGLERDIVNVIVSNSHIREFSGVETLYKEKNYAKRLLNDLPAPSYSIANAIFTLAEKLDI